MSILNEPLARAWEALAKEGLAYPYSSVRLVEALAREGLCIAAIERDKPNVLATYDSPQPHRYDLQLTAYVPPATYYAKLSVHLPQIIAGGGRDEHAARQLCRDIARILEEDLISHGVPAMENLFEEIAAREAENG